MATWINVTPDSLMAQLAKAGEQIDRISKKALLAAAVPVNAQMKSQLRNALQASRTYPKRSTGELLSALGTSPVRIYVTDVYDVKVGFNEPRRKQYKPRDFHLTSHTGAGNPYFTMTANRRYYTATNAMVANILEHGHTGSHGGQKAAPFVKPATKAAKQAAEETLKRVVEDELQKIFGGNT